MATKVKIGSTFAKNFQRDQILVPHLNNWFANAEFPDVIPFEINPNKEKDNAFHPSSALRCLRELYALREGDIPNEEHSMESHKIFMFGHYAHALIQWIVVEELGFASWEDIEQEYDFGWDKAEGDYDGSLVTDNGNPYRVRGFVDIARCNVPNRGTYLVDIKTMNARIFAQTNTPESTVEKWEAQVKLYLDFTGQDEAIVLQAEKDSPHRFKEHLVRADPRFVDEIVAGWEIVVDAQASGEIPECTCLDPQACAAKGIYFEF